MVSGALEQEVVSSTQQHEAKPGSATQMEASLQTEAGNASLVKKAGESSLVQEADEASIEVEVEVKEGGNGSLVKETGEASQLHDANEALKKANESLEEALRGCVAAEASSPSPAHATVAKRAEEAGMGADDPVLLLAAAVHTEVEGARLREGARVEEGLRSLQHSIMMQVRCSVEEWALREAYESKDTLMKQALEEANVALKMAQETSAAAEVEASRLREACAAKDSELGRLKEELEAVRSVKKAHDETLPQAVSRRENDEALADKDNELCVLRSALALARVEAVQLRVVEEDLLSQLNAEKVRVLAETAHLREEETPAVGEEAADEGMPCKVMEMEKQVEEADGLATFFHDSLTTTVEVLHTTYSRMVTRKRHIAVLRRLVILISCALIRAEMKFERPARCIHSWVVAFLQSKTGTMNSSVVDPFSTPLRSPPQALHDALVLSAVRSPPSSSGRSTRSTYQEFLLEGLDLEDLELI